MNSELRTLNCVIALVLFLLAYPSFVRGDELSFTPTFAVREEYNSNILLRPDTDPNNIRRDYITTLSPGFELSDKTGRHTYVLSLGLDRLQYARNSELSANNPVYGLSIDNAATQRLKLNLKADYQKNSNLSLKTGPPREGPPPGTVFVPVEPQPAEPQPPTEPQPQPQPQAPAVPVPTLPLVATAAERISSGASMGYQLTEKTSVSGGYQYSAGSYEQPRYRDKAHSVQAGVATDLGKFLPRVKGRLNAGYSQYLVSAPESRTDSISGTIGFSYDFNETWSIIVDGGLRRTKSRVFVLREVPLNDPALPGATIIVREWQDNASWGGVGHVAFHYRGEYTDVEFGYSRDLTLASGLQAATEQNTLSLTASYRMTPALSAALSTAYGMYRSDPGNTATVIKQNSVSVSPFLRYEFLRLSGEKRNLALDLGYERTFIDYIALDTRADREVYFIRLSARFPFSSSSQYK